MAEADPDSSDTSDYVDMKQMFSIPGFFVGFGTKRTPDSDAPGRSPTSPLDDFGVLPNFGGLFSSSSPTSSSSPHRNKWLSDKVGLSVLSDSIGLGDDECLSDSLTRDNIVLAPQIKLNVNSTQLFGPCVKSSNSLPNNNAAVNIHNPPPSYVVIVEEHTSPRRSSSSPMDIISTQAYSRSLSGRDMALSEDYTCIISHGPNPKTTHIFGDCILDCDPTELVGLDTKEDIQKPEANSLLPTLDSFSRLCLCTQDFHNCHIHREVSAEKESENVGIGDSLDISPGSSYNEDLFPMAMHAS